MNRRGKIYIPAILQKRNYFTTNLVFPDGDDCRSLRSLITANQRQATKLGRHCIIITNARNLNTLCPQNIKDNFGVSAGSVEKKHLRF